MAALALNGHAIRFAGCLLWGVKQTWPENAATMSGTATVSAPDSRSYRRALLDERVLALYI
jgi:hypothetical protein